MLRVLLVLGAFILGSCGVYSQDNPDASRVVDLYTSCGRMGSGYFVEGNKVITAAHVVKCSDGSIPQVRINVRGYGTLTASVTAKDPKGDVALLTTVRRLGWSSVPVRHPSSLRIGERVCAHTGMPSRQVVCGVVKDIYDWSWEFTSSLLVVGGNSGSAVFDAHGNLVGVVVKRSLSNQYSVTDGRLGLLKKETKLSPSSR